MTTPRNDLNGPEHLTQNRPERYEDTENPNFPPNAVTNSKARTAGLWAYFAPLAIIFAFLGIALVYWMTRDSNSSQNVREVEESTVGTTGQTTGGPTGAPGRDSEHGGFDPAGRPDNARDEANSRGADSHSDGPMPALADSTPLTELGDALEGEPREVIGRHINVQDVNVLQASGNQFWIQDGNAKVAVMAPAGVAAVQNGSRVHVSGVIEPDGGSGVRIRATRVTAADKQQQ